MAGDTPKPARTALEAVRSHWGIENSLHWVLDIAFREDECRIRRDHAPENFAILRRAALSLLKQEKSTRLGVHAKRLKAGWDTAYLACQACLDCPAARTDNLTYGAIAHPAGR